MTSTPILPTPGSLASWVFWRGFSGRAAAFPSSGNVTPATIYAGDPAGLLFPTQIDGEYVVPDTMSYTVRDNSGSVIVSRILPFPTATQLFVGVPSDLNTVAGGKDFENRTVEVLYARGDRAVRVRKTYRVAQWVNMTCTEADVRAALGVLDHELQDSDIDLLGAYLFVQEAASGSILTTALAAGNLTTTYANQAIVSQAALRVLPSLQLRAAVAIKDDNQTFQRASALDFAALQAGLQDDYDDALVRMIPLADRVPGTSLSTLVVTLPTDVITAV